MDVLHNVRTGILFGTKNETLPIMPRAVCLSVCIHRCNDASDITHPLVYT